MAKPKLCLIPAAQGDKFYSVLPSSGVGDFDFTRSGGATRINSQGLIETVADGVSRLNYPLIDGKVVGCPSHLLEPTRTNSVLNSQELDNAYWAKSFVQITPNTSISPDGTLNADTLTASAVNSVLYKVGISCGSISFFAKDIDLSIGKFRISVDNVGICLWNKDGSLHSVNGGTATSGVDYGNGWFRFTFNVTSGSVVNYGIGNGSGSESILVWGLQNEPNALYSTSYIPTTTSATTRSAETANNSGDASTFNDSEGVLMAEISALADDETYRIISLSDGIAANSINILYSNISNTIRTRIENGGVPKADLSITSNVMLFNKISVLYKSNQFELWVNGFKVGEDLIGIPPSGINKLSFDRGDGLYDFYGNIKQLQYYDSADIDLETLTSWVSFSDMAEGQLYTIE